MQTLPYLEFQTALARHQCTPAALNVSQRQEVCAEARRQWLLEERVLKSPEAASCPDDAVALKDALATIRGRYSDRQAFLVDLTANGLDESLLAESMRRALRVEAVVAKVEASAPKATDVDVELFYWQHHDKFIREERREARHILITLDEVAPGNLRHEVEPRIATMAAELMALPVTARAHRFGQLAQRHSECPTAMNGGILGAVPRGMLYPEVEAALFELSVGTVGVVESPMGLHLLFCAAIYPAGIQPFSDVAGKIRETLQKRRNHAHLKAWLKALP